MSQVTRFASIRRTVILTLLSAPAVSAVSAAEFCVTCDEPAAHYKCVLPGPAATPADTRLRLLCITELAKAGKHASCSVDRQQKMPCDGAVKEIALPGGIEFEQAPMPPAATPGPPAATAGPPPATAPAPPVASAPPADATPPAQTDIPKTQQPPATVKEAVESGVKSTEKAIEDSGHAASEAAKATGSTFEKAGQAVGNAAKKTWTCISSFFGDC